MNYCVYKRSNKWVVREINAKRALRLFDFKCHALDYAIYIAKRKKASVILYYENMQVQRTYNFN